MPKKNESIRDCLIKYASAQVNIDEAVTEIKRILKEKLPKRVEDWEDVPTITRYRLIEHNNAIEEIERIVEGLE